MRGGDGRCGPVRRRPRAPGGAPRRCAQHTNRDMRTPPARRRRKGRCRFFARGDGLGGAPRRGQNSRLSALGSRLSALLVMQPTRLPNTVERIAKSSGKLWGEPSPPARSEPFSETPAHRGPDHDSTSVEKCAVPRNRFFLRDGSVFLSHIPARYFMHNPTRPGNRTAPLHRHRRPQRRCPRSRPP